MAESTRSFSSGLDSKRGGLTAVAELTIVGFCLEREPMRFSMRALSKQALTHLGLPRFKRLFRPCSFLLNENGEACIAAHDDRFNLLNSPWVEQVLAIAKGENFWDFPLSSFLAASLKSGHDFFPE